MGWIAAHSPQATAHDRLVKGLLVAAVNTLEQANAYLDAEYLPQ